MVSVLETSPVVPRSADAVEALGDGCHSECRPFSALGRGRLGVRRSARVVVGCGASGQGEEDLVEGGLAQGDVVDLDSGGVERAEGRH